MYGGLNLTSCTAGFTFKNTVTGTKGYLTAAHCGSQKYLFPPSNPTSFTSPFVSQKYDAYADVQFRKYDSHLPKHFFYGSSATTLTAQVSGSAVSTGTYVCHRGKTTGYNCGSVTSITYAPSWANACNGVTCAAAWVRTTAYGQPGDSGGPWFKSNGAIGIYKGQANDGSYTIYSKITYRPSNLGLCSATTCP